MNCRSGIEVLSQVDNSGESTEKNTLSKPNVEWSGDNTVSNKVGERNELYIRSWFGNQEGFQKGNLSDLLDTARSLLQQLLMVSLLLPPASYCLLSCGGAELGGGGIWLEIVPLLSWHSKETFRFSSAVLPLFLPSLSFPLIETMEKKDGRLHWMYFQSKNQSSQELGDGRGAMSLH